LQRIKISPADREFSIYIRTRDKWKCRRCGKYQEGGLQCSHFWGRGNKGTRFEPDNCDALCYGCHSLWESNKQGANRDFKLKQLGEARYKSLEIQAHTPTKVDEKLVRMWVKQEMKKLEGI